MKKTLAFGWEDDELNEMFGEEEADDDGGIFCGDIVETPYGIARRFSEDHRGAVSLHMYKHMIQQLQDQVDSLQSGLSIAFLPAIVPTDGNVYFFQAEIIGRIKIGLTNVGIPKRFQQIVLASPLPLRIVGEIKSANPVTTESNLHAKFAHARVHGEWFEPVPELLNYIESLREGK